MLNENLEEAKLKQSMMKKVVPRVRARGQNKELAVMIANEKAGKVLPHARHLGGRHLYNSTNHTELQFRLNAMQAGFADMGEFWTTESSAKLKEGSIPGQSG